MRISFISADKSVGAAGFRGVWTEVLAGDYASPTLSPLAEVACDQFRCEKNDFCIADDLRCNRVENCGFGDSSDEMNCKYFFPALLLSPLLCTNIGQQT